MKRVLLLLGLSLFSVACQQMGPTEMGVRFRRLPTAVGPLKIGGLSSKVIAPGELTLLMPWDRIYTFDTAVKDIAWPAVPEGRHSGQGGGYVNTRALDGNEVALAVTVRYRIAPEPASLLKLVQYVATSDDAVRELVGAVARADIRTYMNELETSAFLDEKSRYAAIDKVKDSMARRLGPYGIEVVRVILNDFRFERLLRDGSIDASYQEKITQTQKLKQDTEREELRTETIKAQKNQEYNTTQAEVNRMLAEAAGYKNQALVRGDAYFESKSNEAKGILALGKAEAEGLANQAAALAGPGGHAILKLEIARRILQANPKFIILSPAAGGLNVQRIDTNELLSQLGVLEAWRKEKEDAPQTVKQPGQEEGQPLVLGAKGETRKEETARQQTVTK